MSSSAVSLVLQTLVAQSIAPTPRSDPSDSCSNNTAKLNCPVGFTNAVFNTNAFNQSGSPQPRWQNLNNHGVHMWVGFPPNQNATDQDPNVVPPYMQATEVRHVSPDPTEVQQTIAALKGPDAPKYVELGNEPDFSWNGSPITPPADVARILKPLLDGAPWPSTTLMSPALANPMNKQWWDTFNSAEGCNGCLNPGGKVEIMAGHQYQNDSQKWINNVETFAGLFPGKEVWMTETSPATQKMECDLNENQMKEWMTTVLKAVTTKESLKNVKKVFWTSAEWKDRPTCGTSLTYENGTATSLLEHYGSLCG